LVLAAAIIVAVTGKNRLLVTWVMIPPNVPTVLRAGKPPPPEPPEMIDPVVGRVTAAPATAAPPALPATPAKEILVAAVV
jgi:hypothetical protein